MEETHSFFPVLMAVLPVTGVIALFSREKRTGEHSLGRYLYSRLWPVALMLPSAWGLWQTDWPIVAVVPVFLSGCSLGILLRGLFNPAWRSVRYGTHVAIALIIVGGWLTKAALDEDGRRYWAARRQSEQLAKPRPPSAEEFAGPTVKHDPERFQGSGVREAQTGSLFAWLALQPLIEVDWTYETERDAARPAQRKIPLSIALLNNQFAPTNLVPIDLPCQYPDETQPALWLAWISRRDGREALVYFSGAMPPGRHWLAPAERVDFTVNWNGRDQGGELLAPGDYTVHLQSAGLAATQKPASLALDFAIQDSGPIIQRILNPVMESLNEKARAQQEWQKNNEAWQRIQQSTWQPVLPQPLLPR